MDTTQVRYLQKACNQLLKDTLVVDGVKGALTTIAEIKLQEKLIQLFMSKSYRLEELNLVGIRMSDTYTNKFSDWCIVFSNSPVYEKKIVSIIPISTLPGVYGVGAIMNPQWIAGKFGTAVLKEGQYYNVYRLYNTQRGWSGAPYLMQEGNKVTVYRDGNRTWSLDRVEEHSGYFGINFHTWKGYGAEIVNNLSLGCQVTKQSDMNLIVPTFIEMTNNDQDRLITYTLLHATDFNQPLIA